MRNAIRRLAIPGAPWSNKVAQLRGGRTQVTLPRAERDFQPITLWHPFSAPEPLRVFDHHGRILTKVKPGRAVRFVAVPPWWLAWLPGWMQGQAAVWEEQP